MSVERMATPLQPRSNQAGRVNSIISMLQNKSLSNEAFGGADFTDLYVTCGAMRADKWIGSKT